MTVPHTWRYVSPLIWSVLARSVAQYISHSCPLPRRNGILLACSQFCRPPTLNPFEFLCNHLSENTLQPDNARPRYGEFCSIVSFPSTLKPECGRRNVMSWENLPRVSGPSRVKSQADRLVVTRRIRITSRRIWIVPSEVVPVPRAHRVYDREAMGKPRDNGEYRMARSFNSNSIRGVLTGIRGHSVQWLLGFPLPIRSTDNWTHF